MRKRRNTKVKRYFTYSTIALEKRGNSFLQQKIIYNFETINFFQSMFITVLYRITFSHVSTNTITEVTNSFFLFTLYIDVSFVLLARIFVIYLAIISAPIFHKNSRKGKFRPTKLHDSSRSLDSIELSRITDKIINASLSS